MEKRLSTKQCMHSLSFSRPIMMDAKCLFDCERKKITLSIKSTGAECIRRIGFLMQQLNVRMLPCGKTRFYAVYRRRTSHTHTYIHTRSYSDIEIHCKSKQPSIWITKITLCAEMYTCMETAHGAFVRFHFYSRAHSLNLKIYFVHSRLFCAPLKLFSLSSDKTFSMHQY